MKKSILAMLLVLCCTLSLLGCENQVKVKEKETKPVAETEGVETNEKQEEEKVVTGEPGSPEATVVEIFDLTYGQIKNLEWDELETTELDNGTWICTATNTNAQYVFVFSNPYESDDATAEVLTVDGNGDACITDRNSLGDTLDVFPEEIQEQAEPMDGILYVACNLEGKNTELQFDGDTTELIAVQFQREAK